MNIRKHNDRCESCFLGAFESSGGKCAQSWVRSRKKVCTSQIFPIFCEATVKSK